MKRFEDDPEDLANQLETLKAQVAQLLAAAQQPASGGVSAADLERILLRTNQVAADAAQRAANPSNPTHPDISVYSYPEGDRARPRTFKCEMFWAGYDLGLDTTTAEEIELLNRAEPGLYPFRRTDKTMDVLTVTGERNAGGTLTKLLFTFPTKENLETLPGMDAMLRWAFHVQSAEERELATLRQQLEAMKAQAGVAA